MGLDSGLGGTLRVTCYIITIRGAKRYEGCQIRVAIGFNGWRETPKPLH